MIKLNFPDFEFKLKKIDNKTFIFDFVRKKIHSINSRGMGKTTCFKFSNYQEDSINTYRN